MHLVDAGYTGGVGKEKTWNPGDLKLSLYTTWPVGYYSLACWLGPLIDRVNSCSCSRGLNSIQTGLTLYEEVGDEMVPVACNTQPWTGLSHIPAELWTPKCHLSYFPIKLANELTNDPSFTQRWAFSKSVRSPINLWVRRSRPVDQQTKRQNWTKPTHQFCNNKTLSLH